MFRGRLMCCRCEARIAASPASAMRYRKALSGSGEIEQPLPRVRVVNHGSYGYRQFNRLAVASGTIAPLAVAAALRCVLGVVSEMQQRVVVLARAQDHIAAPPAIAAARSSARNVLLSAKREAAVPAIARLDGDDYFVYEHNEPDSGPETGLAKNGEPAGRAVSSARR